MKLCLWRQTRELPRPIAASGERHEVRTSLYVTLDDGRTVGCGEVAPQNLALHGDPGVDDVVAHLIDIAIPRFLRYLQSGPTQVRWSHVGALTGSTPADRPATALLEMAVLDHALRNDRRSVAELWETVPPNKGLVTFSIVDDPAATVRAPSAAVGVRVKTAASVPLARYAALDGITVPLLLDFNCGGGDVATVLSHVTEARSYVSQVVVEQPFAVGDFVQPAELRERGVTLSLDESVRTMDDVRNALRYQAADMVCVKPARVGGFASARALAAEATRGGLEVYVGGFFESPFARTANACLAGALATRPSDVLLDSEPLSEPLAGVGPIPADMGVLLECWEIDAQVEFTYG